MNTVSTNIPPVVSNVLRNVYLTARRIVTRDKRRTVMFRSMWLRGQYAVHTAAQGQELHNEIVDMLVSVLPGEPTNAYITDVRSSPMYTITGEL